MCGSWSISTWPVARTAPSKLMAAAQELGLGEGAAVAEGGKGQRHQRQVVEQVRDLFQPVARQKQHAEPLPGRFAHLRIEAEERPAAAG